MTDAQRMKGRELTERILTLIDASDVDSEFVTRRLFIEIGRQQVARGNHLNSLLKEIVNGEG